MTRTWAKTSIIQGITDKLLPVNGFKGEAVTVGYTFTIYGYRPINHQITFEIKQMPWISSQVCPEELIYSSICVLQLCSLHVYYSFFMILWWVEILQKLSSECFGFDLAESSVVLNQGSNAYEKAASFGNGPKMANSHIPPCFRHPLVNFCV